jgi:hypothetical protein
MSEDILGSHNLGEVSELELGILLNNTLSNSLWKNYLAQNVTTTKD